MTGYESKRAAAQDKLEDDDTLTIAYQSGFYDGKKAAQRPWVGLTDGERLEAAGIDAAGIDAADEWFWEVVEAIEAKLKEKNT